MPQQQTHIPFKAGQPAMLVEAAMDRTQLGAVGPHVAAPATVVACSGDRLLVKHAGGGSLWVTVEQVSRPAAKAAPAPDPVPGGGRPEDVVMPFGKHVGRTLGRIAAEDVRYLDWLRGVDITSDRLREAVAQMCERHAPAIQEAIGE